MRLFTKIALFTFLLFTLHYTLSTAPAYANNIRVENAQFYKSADQPTGTIDIKFDVIWDNPVSGTDGNTATFFDRAWVFVKFWDTTAMGDSATGGTGGAYPWGHAILTTGGSLSTYSATTNTGISADGIGAFASPGTNQTVRWNYAATLIPGTSNYVASTDTVKVRVGAIEMCYIPAGSFYVGDGTTASVQGQFCSYNSVTTPFQITQALQQNGITLGGGGEGSLANNNASGMATADDFNNTTSKALASTFPMGYNAFYLMKYEVTEGQYVFFLNSLTRKQQKNRVAATITADSPGSGYVYVMVPSATSTYRNTITCPASGNGTTAPITFSTARPYRNCNYLSWMDLCAYADWAGLRPMTELEFEKAARGGGSTYIADEGAWGGSTQTTIVAATTISGTEDGTETIGPATANCNYNNRTFTGGDAGQGPLRAGIFATPSATRTSVTRTLSGAGCYGNMDLSGSLWERPVTVGNVTGRLFTGTNGDGTLTINTTSNTYDGCATNTDWPGYAANQGVYNSATGSGFRGGLWDTGWTLIRVSARFYAALTDRTRYNSYGGHCARTSP